MRYVPEGFGQAIVVLCATAFSILMLTTVPQADEDEGESSDYSGPGSFTCGPATASEIVEMDCGPETPCYCLKDPISATGSRRALVVYVKFPDDTTNWYAAGSPPFPCWKYGWNDTLDTKLPRWADSLLSTSATPGTLGTAGQLGMSNYFYQMSDSAHWLYGDVGHRRCQA